MQLLDASSYAENALTGRGRRKLVDMQPAISTDMMVIDVLMYGYTDNGMTGEAKPPQPMGFLKGFGGMQKKITRGTPLILNRLNQRLSLCRRTTSETKRTKTR